MYETFDHTADLGLRIRAPNLDALFAEAGQALFSTIVTDLATIRPTIHREIMLPPDDREFLFFDWLKQLLYWWDAEHLLFGKFEVQVTETGLTATAWGEPLDRQRHQLEHEVKAITYHCLKVESEGDSWLAEVIVDI